MGIKLIELDSQLLLKRLDRKGTLYYGREELKVYYFLFIIGYYPKSSWVTGKDLLEKDPKAICRYIKGVLRL